MARTQNNDARKKLLEEKIEIPEIQECKVANVERGVLVQWNLQIL